MAMIVLNKNCRILGEEIYGDWTGLSNVAHQNWPSENNVERLAFDRRSWSPAISPGRAAEERLILNAERCLMCSCCPPFHPGVDRGEVANSGNLAHASVVKMSRDGGISAWLVARGPRFYRTGRDIFLHLRQCSSKCSNMLFVAAHQTHRWGASIRGPKMNVDERNHSPKVRGEHLLNKTLIRPRRHCEDPSRVAQA